MSSHQEVPHLSVKEQNEAVRGSKALRCVLGTGDFLLLTKYKRFPIKLAAALKSGEDLEID